MRRVLLLSALGLIGCSAAKADPSPDLAARPRIELRTVKQNFGTIIGAYVRDNEIGEPVAPAQAEDGKQRWLPIEQWAPSATPVPRSVHSSDLGLWLDPGCSIGFAVTPQTTRPKFIWQSTPGGFAVWQLVAWRYVPDVSKEPMWTGPGPIKCVPLSEAQKAERLKNRGAWGFYERWLPNRFVEYTATETAAEQSVTPSFPLITAPTLGQCAPCEVGNPDHCGGDPARCYKVANTPGAAGCCL